MGVAGWSKKFTLTDHTNGINSLAISNDGTQVVTGSNDNTAIVCNILTGVRLFTFKGHT